MAKRSFSKSGVKARPITFFIVAFIIVLTLVISLTGLQIPVPGKTEVITLYSVSQIRFGIDIRGGVEAVFAPKDFAGIPTADQLESAKSIITTRMDNLNILDREVTIDQTRGQILVRFPRKTGETESDTPKALKELGETALLTFRDPDGKIILTGSLDVVSASVSYAEDLNGANTLPIVDLVLTEHGRIAFKEATTRLVGQSISIYMDDVEISSPTVQEAIDSTTCQITNIASREEATALANKINAGSLPFALETINGRSISATMGQGALSVMVLAGLVAFGLICLFMLIFYRLPGFVACWSLLAQIIGILLAISIPQQTLTLEGITGIILSIGMGVDANVIISARIKEELRAGSSLPLALSNGFDRALSAVVDGNITVAIAAAVLMAFGSGAMLSFGYSLLIGVILNGLTGVIASRLMIGSLSQFKIFKNVWLYGARRVKNNV